MASLSALNFAISGGTSFRGANLTKANFAHATLNNTDFREAILIRTCWREAKGLEYIHPGATYLRSAKVRQLVVSGKAGQDENYDDQKMQGISLHKASLQGANFRRADLEGADLSGADLRDADLSSAVVRDADLSGAYLGDTNLADAVLSGADFQGAALIDSCLDRADLTGARLWNTQRAGWSIKGVICQWAFWDQNGLEAIEYRDGDFERVYAEKPCIVLRYPGGISPVDLAMLPLIIERLQAEHPDCALHIRSVQDDGSGATVTITVEDRANRDRDTFRQEVDRLQSEVKYIEGQRDLLIDQFMPMFRELVVRGGQTIIGQITAPTTIGSTTMNGDTNINHGQAGVVGRDAHAHDMTFQQVVNQGSIDLPRLADELARLRTAMKQEADGTDEHDEAIGAVAAAGKAAGQGDGPAALQHLKSAGKWTLGVAEKIGVAVAVEALKRAM
jgi:uncharacterized protein YjbI with pentapeptide repeats